MFEQKFHLHVSTGDSISCEVDGFKCKATVYNDDDSDAPWISDCWHGPVSEWTTRAKKPGELVLCESHSSKRYYDLHAAHAIAVADSWGLPGGRKEGESIREYAARAAGHDYDVLKAWCNDKWFYCGVAVTVEFNGIKLTGKYDHALWGIEANYPGSDNNRLLEVANEYLATALGAAKARAKELRAQLASIESDCGE